MLARSSPKAWSGGSSGWRCSDGSKKAPTVSGTSSGCQPEMSTAKRGMPASSPRNTGASSAAPAPDRPPAASQARADRPRRAACRARPAAPGSRDRAASPRPPAHRRADAPRGRGRSLRRSLSRRCAWPVSPPASSATGPGRRQTGTRTRAKVVAQSRRWGVGFVTRCYGKRRVGVMLLGHTDKTSTGSPRCRSADPSP
jgi:hypothetical protein